MSTATTSERDRILTMLDKKKERRAALYRLNRVFTTDEVRELSGMGEGGLFERIGPYLPRLMPSTVQFAEIRRTLNPGEEIHLEQAFDEFTHEMTADMTNKELEQLQKRIEAKFNVFTIDAPTSM